LRKCGMQNEEGRIGILPFSFCIPLISFFKIYLIFQWLAFVEQLVILNK